MALSGSVSTSKYDGRYYTLSWTATQNVAANTSTISWTLSAAGGAVDWYAERTLKVNIAGTNVFSKTDRVERGKGTIKTGTLTLTHNSAGAKSFAVSIEAAVYTSAVNCTGSGTFALNTIYRASTLSASNGTLGTAMTLTITRPSTSLTHSIAAACGSASVVIADKSTSTSISWTPPLAWASQNTAGTSVSVKFTIRTFNGSTQTGLGTKTISCAIPASVKPTCSLQVLDPTGIKDKYGVLLKGLSKFAVKVTTSQAFGSPIVSCKTVANGNSYTATEFTTGELLTSGNLTVSTVIKDKRGRIGSASATFPVQDYTRPTVSALDVYRCNEDGTENDQGDHVKVVYSAAIDPISKQNKGQITVRYKKPTEASFMPGQIMILGSTIAGVMGLYSYSDTYIFPADSGASYDVEVEVKDNHFTTIRTTSASTAATILNFHPAGNGLGVGKVSEDQNTMEVAWKSHLYDTLQLEGNRYCMGSPGVAGTAGFVRMASITITAANADTPITFVLTQRRALTPMHVHICLTNADMNDSSLGSIVYEGTNYDAYVTKAGPLTWDLYVKKGSTYDTITLQDWWTSYTMDSRIDVTFPGNLVDTVPGTYYKATPAKLRSLLDHVFPVGSIYLAYSHTSPADLFGGTWVRLENTFLWAIDENGGIGVTGGSKTHTLTVAELPVHDHGATYTGEASTKNQAWIASSTTKNMGYQAISAGSGAAHNNMPPYTQISAWRRTA